MSGAQPIEAREDFTEARFNPRVAGLSTPPIPAVQAWAGRYDGAHGRLLDLAQAVPGYPPHDDLLTWLGEAASSAAMTGYGPIEGDPALRAAYAGEVAQLYGTTLGARNVHITAGCNQAFIVAVMALAGAGDRVVLTNPCYFNHETSLEMLGIGVDYVSCSPERGFVPDPADVEAALGKDVRVVALVSPNNPTGAVYPPDVLEAIFDICRRKGVWLVLDETYRDFLPLQASAPHAIFSRAGWQDHFVQLYSFSKSFCIPGHRVGAITAGEDAVEQMAKIMDNLQICAPRPAQAALVRGLARLDDWRADNRLRIARRAEALTATLADTQGWHLRSLGAYFAFLEHPFEEGAEAVARRLATDLGVLTLPGTFFGKGLERYLRVAFANVDVDAMGRLGPRLRKL